MEPATVFSSVLDVKVLKLIEVSWVRSESKIDIAGIEWTALHRQRQQGISHLQMTLVLSQPKERRKQESQLLLHSPHSVMCNFLIAFCCVVS